MNLLVLIITIMVGAVFSTLIAFGTNITAILQNKLKINTKRKCIIISLICLAISTSFFLNKNIVNIIGLFMCVLIGGLSDSIRRQL